MTYALDFFVNIYSSILMHDQYMSHNVQSFSLEKSFPLSSPRYQEIYQIFIIYQQWIQVILSSLDSILSNICDNNNFIIFNISISILIMIDIFFKFSQFWFVNISSFKFLINWQKILIHSIWFNISLIICIIEFQYILLFIIDIVVRDKIAYDLERYMTSLNT